MQAEHSASPQRSLTLEKAGFLGAVAWGDGHGGGSGARCCDRDRAGRRWSAERTRPANSLNGSDSGTGDQGRAFHMGSAADSKMAI